MTASDALSAERWQLAPTPTLGERLAEHTVEIRELARRITWHDKSLYGIEGGGGLTADVHHMMVREKLVAAAGDKALNQIVEVVVGKDGTGGHGGDIAFLLEDAAKTRTAVEVLKAAAEKRAEASRWAWRDLLAPALMGLLTAVLGSLLIAWLSN